MHATSNYGWGVCEWMFSVYDKFRLGFEIKLQKIYNPALGFHVIQDFFFTNNTKLNSSHSNNIPLNYFLKKTTRNHENTHTHLHTLHVRYQCDNSLKRPQITHFDPYSCFYRPNYVGSRSAIRHRLNSIFRLAIHRAYARACSSCLIRPTKLRPCTKCLGGWEVEYVVCLKSVYH